MSLIATPFAKSSSRIASAVAKSCAFFAAARSSILASTKASNSASTPAFAIARYVELRDELASIKADYKAKEDEIKNKMFELECELKGVMDSLGMESIRTNAGTAYLKESTFINTCDKSAFFDYCKENDRWDLLDIRGSKTSIKDFIDENQEVPPGIDLRRELTIGIRRA